ncbi:hypothetical protein KAH94_04765, partial [bacterium]|nr:hypothetical protein [bacterium]
MFKLWYSIIMSHRIFNFILLLFFVFCLPCHGKTQSLELHADVNDIRKDIQLFLQSSAVLKEITYHSDVFISAKEFYYLVDLQKNKPVSYDSITLAVLNLFKKNKFKKITILKIEEQDGRLSLHFELTSFWTFGRLKFHGVAIAKDAYRQYYEIEPGDLFDEKKHQHSLGKIKIALKREGYFDGDVVSDIVRNEKTKSITVHLSLFRGQRFKIGKIFTFCKKQKDHVALVDEDIKLLFDSFSEELNGKNYCKKIISKDVAEIKKQLQQKGFLCSGVVLREQVNYEQKKVDLTFSFSFLKKREFVFWGNSFFSDTHLLQTVLMFGNSAWLVPASILAQEIEREYHEKGFWDFSILAREEDEREFFVIKEGRRAVTKEVVFKGSSSFDTAYLSKRFFKSFLRQKYFDDDTLKKSLHALLLFYQTQGFLNVNIINQDFVAIDTKNQTYRFEVVIDEGQKSFIHSVSIDLFPELALRGPFAKCNKKKELIPFDPRSLKEQKKWLKQHLKIVGYSNVRAHSTVEHDKTNVSVNWNVDVQESKDTFGKTIVLGSCDFPFDKVQKELCYKEGEVWSSEKIKQSTQRLQSLNIFESVHLYPERN